LTSSRCLWLTGLILIVLLITITPPEPANRVAGSAAAHATVSSGFGPAKAASVPQEELRKDPAGTPRRLEASERHAAPGLDILVTDHEGATATLKALVDRPTALAFFYTGCHNPLKCSRTVAEIERLHRMLEGAGLAGKARLLLLSLEPSFDTPDLLKSYGEGRGIGAASKDVLLLRPDPARLRCLLEGLDVPVGFVGTDVSVHDSYLLLLDRHGLKALEYRSRTWTPEEVLPSLTALCLEP
jgi:cytochrome oxidase Cu insertion factor (SCO1/SenC/PrrC family)